jgi:hypothetical protein
MNKVIDLSPRRSHILPRRRLSASRRYENALQDFGRGEAMDPADWAQEAFGLLFQAHCHARLGHEENALAYCARLPDDFLTPGLEGAPAGDKAQIADQLRYTAG